MENIEMNKNTMIFQREVPGCGTRKWIKRAGIVVIAIIVCVCFLSIESIAAKNTRALSVIYDNLKIKIDGALIIPKDASGNQIHPFLYEDTTYLPLRALSTGLGCDVIWNDVTATANIISKGNATLEYGIPDIKISSEIISVEFADITVMIDGKKASLKNEPFIYKGTTYMPLREIATILSCTVDFDDKTKTILIQREQAVEKTGTQQTEAGAAPGTTGNFSKADMMIVISGKNVSIDQNVTVVTQILGNKYEYEEAVSCAYTGMDKMYRYSGIEISTLPIGGTDQICAIDVFSNVYKTGKSITIGSTLSEIEMAYGKDYTLDAGVLVYWGGVKNDPKTPQLYFTLNKENMVKNFGIYNGKSSG